MRPSALILHLPHSATTIPASVRQSLLLSDADLSRELLRITDAYTDELFACDSAATVRFPVSRLVVDPERFENDEEEDMTRCGMGVVYTKTIDGHPLRMPPTPSQRDALLAAYYRPHHNALTNTVSAALGEHGHCLILDCHSFPQVPLPYERDKNPERPDICIGTDSFHTSPELKDALVSSFQKHGYSVAVDRPFAGAVTPAKFYRRDRNVRSVMIEVNRALYMDEARGEKSHGFVKTREAVVQVISLIALATADRKN